MILTNPNNVLGAIKVVAGVLAVSNSAALGGAKSVEISDGGGLRLSTDTPLTTGGDLVLNAGSRLIVEVSDKQKSQTSAGKKITLVTVSGKRTGEFATVTASDPSWRVEAKWDGAELRVVLSK